MPVRYVIFDLDDTLVHSDAVRHAFCDVAARLGIVADAVNEACDALPGQPALAIFEALGLCRDDAADAAVAFLACLEEFNRDLPAIPYCDADETLRAMRRAGAQLILSTGSSEVRARRVLDETGWQDFELVLGTGPSGRKGCEHFELMSAHLTGKPWTGEAATVGDSPEDMRLGVQHGVPVRIGLDRGTDAQALRDAGATHVVRQLSDILAIIAAAA